MKSGLPHPKNEHQQSINDLWPSILEKPWSVPQHQPIIEQLAAIIGDNGCDSITTMSSNWASTEYEWFLALHLRQSKDCGAILTSNQTICRLSSRRCLWQHRHYVLRISVNRASTECQQFLAFDLGISNCGTAILTQNRTTSHLSRHKCFRQHHYYVLYMSVNWATTIWNTASQYIQGLYSNINP